MRFRLLPRFALLVTVAGCTPTEPPGPSDPLSDTYAATLEVDIASMTKVRPDADVYYKDLTVGTGAVAVENKAVVITYAGYLTNGTLFDSGDTDACFLDTAHYISGWVIGVSGMKVGGKRKLVIGSLQAYGSKGNGPIPANATIVFDVELKEVRTTQAPACL
jgi:FKBP-type peptidyl-prolyl cis-trans isomerase FkpA